MNQNKIELWHCHNARSLRPLWALEEMGLAYELHVLPFPPRFFDKSFLEINPLGTVPYFKHGTTTMTESSAICHYLVDQFKPSQLAIEPSHAEYGAYLNWLYHSDATLTFPQTIFIRYQLLEPDERKNPVVAEDYAKWFIARLRLLDQHINEREFLCAERFTIADIAVGYALFLGELNGFKDRYTPQVIAYLERLKQRDAFQRAVGRTADLDTPSLI